MKNILVLYTYYFINGAVYDAVEYTHVLSKYSNTKLVVFNPSRHKDVKQVFTKAIRDKYTISPESINIEIKNSKYSIDTKKYDGILVIDSTSLMYSSIYIADKVAILADYVPRDLDLYLKIKRQSRSKTFNEMPFFPSEVNYKYKHDFTIFKKYDVLDDCTLYSYKDADNSVLHSTKLVYNSNNKDISLTWPVEDFHRRFNRYVYTNYNYFDPRPRLFHECYFYGIPYDRIIRNINAENYDGAFFKLKDLKENGLKDRQLDKNDEILDYLLGD